MGFTKIFKLLAKFWCPASIVSFPATNLQFAVKRVWISSLCREVVGKLTLEGPAVSKNFAI